MHLHVEWNDDSSVANLRERGVCFDEAATVLGDPLSRTIMDPAHAADAFRFVTLGLSNRARMLVVTHLDRGCGVWVLSARRALRSADATWKQMTQRATAPHGTEYDFSTGITGKYATRYWESAACRQLRRGQRSATVRSS